MEQNGLLLRPLTLPVPLEKSGHEPACLSICRPRPNGNMPVVRGRHPPSITVANPWKMRKKSVAIWRMHHIGIRTDIGANAKTMLVPTKRMLGGCMTCMAISRNGAWTGWVICLHHRWIPKELLPDQTVECIAVGHASGTTGRPRLIFAELNRQIIDQAYLDFDLQ